MIQEIITWIILLLVVLVIIRKHTGKSKKKRKHDCDGCQVDCGSCPIIEMKREIKDKK